MLFLSIKNKGNSRGSLNMSDSFETSKRPGPESGALATLKVPPSSIEAEQAVIGGLMLDNSEWDNVSDLVIADDFYRPEHQIIFRVMYQHSEENQPIDVVTLGEALDRLHELDNAGGIDYLGELASNARGTANIKAYAEIIRERSVLRTRALAP